MPNPTVSHVYPMDKLGNGHLGTGRGVGQATYPSNYTRSASLAQLFELCDCPDFECEEDRLDYISTHLPRMEYLA